MSTSTPEPVETPSVQRADPHTSIIGGVDAETFTAPQDGMRRTTSAVGTGVLKKSPDLKNVSFGGITSEDGRKPASNYSVSVKPVRSEPTGEGATPVSPPAHKGAMAELPSIDTGNPVPESRPAQTKPVIVAANTGAEMGFDTRVPAAEPPVKRADNHTRTGAELPPQKARPQSVPVKQEKMGASVPSAQERPGSVFSGPKAEKMAERPRASQSQPKIEKMTERPGAQPSHDVPPRVIVQSCPNPVKTEPLPQVERRPISQQALEKNKIERDNTRVASTPSNPGYPVQSQPPLPQPPVYTPPPYVATPPYVPVHRPIYQQQGPVNPPVSVPPSYVPVTEPVVYTASPAEIYRSMAIVRAGLNAVQDIFGFTYGFPGITAGGYNAGGSMPLFSFANAMQDRLLGLRSALEDRYTNPDQREAYAHEIVQWVAGANEVMASYTDLHAAENEEFVERLRQLTVIDAEHQLWVRDERKVADRVSDARQYDQRVVPERQTVNRQANEQAARDV